MPEGVFIRYFIANLLQGTAFSMLLHMPGFLLELGATEVLVGVLAGVGAGAGLAAAPLLGSLLDRRGRLIPLQVGLLLHTMLCLCYGLFSQLSPVLYLLRMLHGAIESLLNIGFFTAAADIADIPANRARPIAVLALFGVSAIGAVGAGALVGDVAHMLGGYIGVFLVAGALSTLAAVLTLWLPETRPDISSDADVNESSVVQRFEHAAPDPGSGSGSGSRSAVNWQQLFVEPAFLAALMVAAAFFAAMACLFAFMKAWVLMTGVGSLGGYFVVYSGTAVLLRILLGWVPDRIGSTPALVICLTSYALGFLVLAALSFMAIPEDGTTGPAWANLFAVVFYVAALLGGIGHGYGYPVLLRLITAGIAADARGKAVALFDAIDAGAALIAAPVFGVLLVWWGYSLGFVLVAVLVLMAMLVYTVTNLARSV